MCAWYQRRRRNEGLLVRNMDTEEEKEFLVLTTALDISVRKGWITENERLQMIAVHTPISTLKYVKLALYDMIKSIKCDSNASRLIIALRVASENQRILVRNPKSDADNPYLPILMPRLFEKGLISEAEMLPYATLKQSEDDESSSKEVSNGDLFELNKNPMKISTIIKSVYQFLNFEEVKNARYISKEWKHVGLNVLAARSTIKFSNKWPNQSASDKGPIKFFQVFPDTPNEIIPFTKFSISGAPWLVDELDYFFRHQQKFIRKVDICVALINDFRREIECFDITPWITNSAIAKPNKQETKLSICYDQDKTTTNFSVNWSDLVHTQNLVLKGIDVYLQDGIQIRPKKLKITEIRFLEEGKELKELCVNNFLDLPKIQEMDLKADRHFTSLTLELNGIEEFVSIRLSDVKLKNWATCIWAVTHLTLDNIPFKEKTEMYIEELHIVRSGIDLTVLPQSLEKLVLENVDEKELECSEPVVLHNLKILKLKLCVNLFPIFSAKVKCPELISLILSNDSERGTILFDLAWVPATVKELYFTDIIVKNERKQKLDLDKLVLKSYGLPDVLQIFSYTQTKELVLRMGLQAKGLDVALVKFLGQVCVQRIYVGPFKWKKGLTGPFENSPLLEFVDKKSSFYLFENKIGKAIDDKEFQNMVHK